MNLLHQYYTKKTATGQGAGNAQREEWKMERLEAFEAMLNEILTQMEREKAAMDALKAQGKEKTATYRQYLGNRLMYNRMLDLYRRHGLI